MTKKTIVPVEKLSDINPDRNHAYILNDNIVFLLNNEGSKLIPLSSKSSIGKDGENAYQIALKHGFEGSEKEWITSLDAKPAPWNEVLKKPFEKVSDTYLYLNQSERTLELASTLENLFPESFCMGDARPGANYHSYSVSKFFEKDSGKFVYTVEGYIYIHSTTSINIPAINLPFKSMPAYQETIGVFTNCTCNDTGNEIQDVLVEFSLSVGSKIKITTKIKRMVPERTGYISLDSEISTDTPLYAPFKFIFI